MLYLAYSYLHNKDDAEDTVHDVFLFIAQKHISFLKSIKNDNDIRNYLLKATKNKAIDKIRSKKSEFVDLENVVNQEKLNDNTLEKILLKADYETVLSAINDMKKPYRDALYYHYVLEMTVKQVADFLNQSVSATKQQLVRGKRLLLSNLKGK